MDRISNERVLDHLREFKKRIEGHFAIERMILFGSRARDDWLYESDIDLILVSRDFQTISFLDRIREIASMWDGDLSLEPICYTPDEFERKRSETGIVREAAKHGIDI
jgi:predicted nucleotidyltransferase